MNRTTSKSLAAVCRWSARILGSLLVLLILLIAVGGGTPNPFTQPVAVQLGLLGLALIMAGMLAGWRWDVGPAIVSMAGWCLFFFAVVFPPRRHSVFIFLLALPAVLLLASALLERHGKEAVGQCDG